jgi:hypothetical protein
MYKGAHFRITFLRKQKGSGLLLALDIDRSEEIC